MTKPATNKLLNNEFLKNCARTLAYDLLRYSENGGSMNAPTAAKVYEFLENLNKKDIQPNC